jgi:hypothetical protein
MTSSISRTRRGAAAAHYPAVACLREAFEERSGYNSQTIQQADDKHSIPFHGSNSSHQAAIKFSLNVLPS